MTEQEWLGCTDPRVALASELLVRCGPQAVPDLIREAADSQNSSCFRTRLLGIVERIGAPPDVDSYFDLHLANRGLMSPGGGHVGSAPVGD